jgi:hypothetical protein
MQTFVPYESFQQSAAVLDNKRLNKQLLEGRQIYGILSSSRRTGAWVNHPAVKMWRNYDNGLYAYLIAIYEECVARGIKADKNWSVIEKLHDGNWNRGCNTVMPAWWGDNRVHESHRNNLYVKDHDHYSEFFNAKRTTCCDRCNYFWPTHTLFYNNDLVGLVI